MTLNPNYPVIEELWGPSWTAAGGAFPSTRWVNLVDRTLSQAMARRGKQYELDEAQAGEYQIVLGSQDGALDPTNTSGPYASRILPYQPYRRRAQWPPTANMLTPEIATAGEGYAAGAVPAAFGMTFPSGAVPGAIAALGAGQAWQGSNVFSLAIPNGMASSSGLFFYTGSALKPGKRLTYSLYVANTTASTTTTILPYINWVNADGSTVFAAGSSTPIVGASGTPGWQRITVSATAPTTGSVYGVRIGMNLGAATTAASVIVVDGVQLEWGSAATTWSAPGTWYPVFSGFTERWPTQWADGGTYGQVSPTGVDAFALLSQVTLKDVFLEEIESLSPRFCYTLADGAGATSFADLVGAFPAASLAYSKAGTGNWTSGNAITSASTTGAYTGSTGTVVTSSPASPGSDTAGPATMLDLTSAGVTGPGTTAWTRMIAFRTSTVPTDGAIIWETRTNPNASLQFEGHLRVYVASDGSLNLRANAKLTAWQTTTLVSSSVANGDWHLLTFGFDGTNLRYSFDGSVTTLAYSNVPTLANPLDAVGAAYFAGTRTATNVYKGDLAFVAEFPSLLSSSAISGLYSAWRNSASGESSSARYARILRYSGYVGTSNIGTGLTTAMGPADDLAGTDAMSALASVVTTENGEHFVAADGTVTFQGRGIRYNALTPLITFGEASGEYPYEDLQLDFDSTHLSNYATVTQQPTGTNFIAQDSASIASYYTRTMTRTVNTANPLEAQDAADYFVSRYKDPLTRVQSIKLHPSANVALWPVLLSLELGTRVRINRRPPGAPIVTVDCFVEQIQWEMDSENEAWVTLQCSPIDPHPYAEFAAFHTALNTAASAGATSITLNAGADNTNPLAAQLPAGASLIIGLGTANQETVSLTAVGATTSGWTSSACGISALVNSHSTNEVICEVLPSGVTDPTYYDATEQFDKVLFAY